MCGRFTLRSVDRINLALANRHELDDFVPRYNIAPSQNVFAVTSGNEVNSFVWGLIPSWSTEPKAFINARAETVQTRRTFSESFEQRRCLILADGFYEWQRIGKARKAFYIQLRDESLFAFAGIWDRWKNINTCAIITTDANDLVEPIHDRMPVILPSETYATWLNPHVNPGALRKLLEPFSSDEMKSYPVSSQVNHVDLDNEGLIERVDVEVGTTPSLF